MLRYRYFRSMYDLSLIRKNEFDKLLFEFLLNLRLETEYNVLHL